MNSLSCAKPLHGDPTCVVFDFDHTLYDGDISADFLFWVIRRSCVRSCLATLASPVLGLMLAVRRWRRLGLQCYVWISIFSIKKPRKIDVLVRYYIATHRQHIRARLLDQGLAVLEGHVRAGDRVIVASGSLSALIRLVFTRVYRVGVQGIGSEVMVTKTGKVIVRHCHHSEKVRMLAEHDCTQIGIAYSDSLADLPLLQHARRPVVVNPKHRDVSVFREQLSAATVMVNWGCPSRAGEQTLP